MDYYDSLETRDSAARENDLMAKLPKMVAHAKACAPYYTKLFEGINPDSVMSREALAKLPLTRKSDLHNTQSALPPFGGLCAVPMSGLRHVFCSPGPIYEPEGQGPDPWRMARALYAAGFRAGDLLHNCFSYHFTPGAFIFEGGAAKLGCPVFPAGTGQTEQQVQAMAALKPVGYSGTPSFLKIIFERADEMGVALPSVKKALVSGEALPASLRKSFAERGVSLLQCFATADLGLIAYESQAQEGLILDEALILEIVRPGTGEPVAPGEVGEIVITNFNLEYPLIRFATGDLSAVLPGNSPCGRTNVRIKGWMGRADQTTKVKGMFVHPGQINEVAKRFPAIGRVRLVVDNATGQDRMTLNCEMDLIDDSVNDDVVSVLREITKLRGEVNLHASGSLANDGKVIEDIRTYE